MSGDNLLLRESEIRTLLDPAACIAAVEETFTAYAAGGAYSAGRVAGDAVGSKRDGKTRPSR